MTTKNLAVLHWSTIRPTKGSASEWCWQSITRVVNFQSVGMLGKYKGQKISKFKFYDVRDTSWSQSTTWIVNWKIPPFLFGQFRKHITKSAFTSLTSWSCSRVWIWLSIFRLDKLRTTLGLNQYRHVLYLLRLNKIIEAFLWPI